MNKIACKPYVNILKGYRVVLISTLLVSLLPPFIALAGGSWSQVEVSNGLYVDFPHTPKYTISNTGSYNAATYVTKSNNCLFMTIIARQVFSRYPEFIFYSQKWKTEETKAVLDKFLDSYVGGKLQYVNAVGVIKPITLKQYLGRKVS